MTGPRPAPKVVDAEAVALHFDVPRGTLRRWAHEDGWTRYGSPRRAEYDLHEVEASYARRRDRDAP